MRRPSGRARGLRRQERPGDARTRAWRRWYGVIVRRFEKLSTDEIVWAWVTRVAPNVWRLPGPPPDAERWLAHAGTLLLPPAAARVPRLADHFPARRSSVGVAVLERSRSLRAIASSTDERPYETASPIGEDPPGLFVLTGSGEWWGPKDLADAMVAALRASPAWPYLYPQPRAESGFYFGPPIGQVVRREEVRLLLRLRWRQAREDREEPAKRLAGSLSPAIRATLMAGHLELRNVHVSRRKDVRRGASGRFPRGVAKPVLARSLLVRGLMEEGLTHGQAVLHCFAWDRDLGGALWGRVSPAARAARERMDARSRGSRWLGQPELDDRLMDRRTWSDEERRLSRSHRDLWLRLGLPDPAPPGAISRRLPRRDLRTGRFAESILETPPATSRG